MRTIFLRQSIATTIEGENRYDLVPYSNILPTFETFVAIPNESSCCAERYPKFAANRLPMGANAVENEPQRIRHWEDSKLYQKMLKKNRGANLSFCMMVLLLQMVMFMLERH